MHLKSDRRGITGIVDTMIFITVMAIVFAGVYSLNSDDENAYGPNASQICDQILSSKFSLCDVTDSEDSTLVSASDLLAVSVISKDKSTIEYLVGLLDAVFGPPDLYKMTLSYKDAVIIVDEGKGTPVSKCTKKTTVTYGGQLTTVIELY